MAACPVCARKCLDTLLQDSYVPFQCLIAPGLTSLWTSSQVCLPQKATQLSSLWWTDFSKMVHFIPLPKLPSAKETAEVMIRHVFRHHGFPKDVVLDRGPQFASRFWKAFCSLLGATISLTSGYNPQSNGQTEHLNQELETGLCCLVSQNPTRWSRHLIWVEYAHNTLPCSSSGLSPFHCTYGYQPPLFPVLEEEVSVPSAQALI